VAISKEIKRLDKSNVAMSVTVPKEDVAAQYNDMLKEYTKSLQIPGFRKGKVPQSVLEQKFGDALKGDALGRIIESTMQEIFKDGALPRSEKPLPYATPKLQEEDIKLDFDQDLSFTVIYDVIPEVRVNQWKGFTIEYPYAEVEKEDIDRELEDIRDRNAFVLDCDDSAAAKKGNVVTIDYQIMEEDGVTPMDISRKDMVITLDGKNVFKFDDDIAGMKKGDTKSFEKKFEDDFFDPNLAGKTRKVRITVSMIKEKKLPELDDDLAQDVDEKFRTLDDLINSIKDRMNKTLERRLKDIKLSSLLEKIMETTPVIIPESMINAEVEGRIRRIARYYNTSVDMMMQMTGGDQFKEMRDSSQKALHSRLIIETLIEDQKIETTDDELSNEIEKIASEHNADISEVKKQYESEEAKEYLKEDIKEKKLIDIMFAENTLKQGKKENYLAFMSDNV